MYPFTSEMERILLARAYALERSLAPVLSLFNPVMAGLAPEVFLRQRGILELPSSYLHDAANAI